MPNVITTAYPLSSADGKAIPLDTIRAEKTRLTSITTAALANCVDLFPTTLEGLFILSNLGIGILLGQFTATNVPVAAIAVDIDYTEALIIRPNTDYIIYGTKQYFSAISFDNTSLIAITTITQWDALTLPELLAQA